jgi:hypothetical protein
MKLSFRGQTYAFPAPSQLDATSTNQPKIKLIYRGHTYNYTPRPVGISVAIVTDEPTVTLIYRGNTYERNLQAPKAYQKPRAINWRWKFD